MFEKRNGFQLVKKPGFIADILFEISSEGELEQVFPYINWCIEQGKKIEIIFFSESVESKCLSLASDRVRVIRFPMVTYFRWNILGGQNLRSWISAKKVVLCRYDFFPEIMLYGAKKDVTFILLSATLKNKKLKIFPYSLFQKIVTTTKKDAESFKAIGIDRSRVDIFEFRTVQILRRLDNYRQTLENYLFFKPFIEYLENFSQNHRLILGSAWPIEMKIFRDENFLSDIKNRKIQVTICPHKLGQADLDKLVKEIEGVLEVYILSDKVSDYDLFFKRVFSAPGVIVVTIPRILCELYSCFGHSFVGGGHGRSIHSVLEPYLAYSQIYVGPKIHRSTEYDLVYENSSDYITVIDDLNSFYSVFLKKMNLEIDNVNRGKIINNFKSGYKSICRELDIC